ncbi:MAG: radical SAM protein, partial [Candidatus Omnitrophota bacterium]
DTGLIKYFDLKRKVYTPERRDLFPGAGGCYFILASRGCPFSCTYCSNSLYHSIDPRFRKVRKRSVGNILSEMSWARRKGFKSFYIADDSFFSFSKPELEAFGRGYKREIKKPFSVVGLNPKALAAPDADKKLKILLDCGLSDVRIGVQSGSDNTLKVFNRGYKAADVPKMLEVIDRNRKTIWPAPYDTLHVALDFICDAAWETDEDKIATIRLAQKLLRQYSIFFYTLVYLPGTTIYHMAREKGWVSSHEKDIYLRGIAGVDDNIYNRILFLIAVSKERGVTLKDSLIDHLVELSGSDRPRAQEMVDSIVECINGVEMHHKVNLAHAAIHPYLTGFNEWTKTKGDVGRKVLFRSYHQPYG